MIKEFYKSKTLWISVLTIAGGICAALADHLVAGGVLSTVGIIQLILRCVTSEEISF